MRPGTRIAQEDCRVAKSPPQSIRCGVPSPAPSPWLVQKVGRKAKIS